MIFDIFLPFLLPSTISTSPHTHTETIKQDTTTSLHGLIRKHLYRSFNQLLGSLDLDDDKIEGNESTARRNGRSFMFSKSLMKVHQSTGLFYLLRLRNDVELKKMMQSKMDLKRKLLGLEVSLCL
jgi:hypothetical protein